MNKKQKVAFLVGVGIVAIMGLIPPWYYHVVRSSDQRLAFEGNGGYAFLFSPPSFYERSFKNPQEFSRIDLSRLLVQWVVVAIATVGIVFILRDDNGRSQG